MVKIGDVMLCTSRTAWWKDKAHLDVSRVQLSENKRLVLVEILQIIR